MNGVVSFWTVSLLGGGVTCLLFDSQTSLSCRFRKGVFLGAILPLSSLIAVLAEKSLGNYIINESHKLHFGEIVFICGFFGMNSLMKENWTLKLLSNVGALSCVYIVNRFVFKK